MGLFVGFARAFGACVGEIVFFWGWRLRDVDFESTSLARSTSGRGSTVTRKRVPDCLRHSSPSVKYANVHRTLAGIATAPLLERLEIRK